MYFLWRDSPYGFIRVSCEGLLNFINDALRSKFRLYGVALSPLSKKSDLNENTDITIVISDEDLCSDSQSDKKTIVEGHLIEVLKPMGMNAKIIWASPEKGFLQFLQSPYIWALTASCVAVIVTAGFNGFFWTAFWGTAAWFAIRGLLLLAKKFRRN